MAIIHVVNDNIEYKYIDIEYKIKEIHPMIELVGYKLLDDIVKQNDNLTKKDVGQWIILQMFKNMDKNNGIGLFPFENTCAAYDNSELVHKIGSNKKCYLADQSKDAIKKLKQYVGTFGWSTRYNVYFKHVIDKSKKVYFEINKNILRKMNLSINRKNYVIPLDVYNSMCKRFNGKTNYYKDSSMHFVDDLICCLLLRYDAIGIHIGKHNNYDCLREKADFNCFTTAFQQDHEHYCSLFYDIEQYFGSKGFFQNIEIIKGTYLVEPPRSKIIVTNVLKKIFGRRKGSFIIVLPEQVDSYGIDIANHYAKYRGKRGDKHVFTINVDDIKYNCNKKKISKINYDCVFNPQLVVKPVVIKNNNKTFNIVRDDYLVGGTKQRMLGKIIELHDYNEYVYAGPVFGFAQIALSYVCHVLNKKATLFLEYKNPRWSLTKYAMKFNPKIVEIDQPASLKKVQSAAKQYASDKKNTYLIPFGLGSDEFIDILHKQIKDALPKKMIKHPPKRFWLVAGSATILNALYKVFPNTYFNVVQVGKKIWPDQLDETRTTLYVSDEYFTKQAKIQPPYRTVKTYDAKLWKYVLKYGQTGDYVWNVGGEKNEK